MSDMQPLRIEWRLATPWCPPARGFHLDGLIALAMIEQATDDGVPHDAHAALLDELPFARHETPSGWVWKASMIRADGVHGSERRYMTTKTAVEEFGLRMANGSILGKPLATIDTVRGPYKQDAFWYTVEHADRCVAYAIGDPERLVPLLERVTHLGKRSRLDHGRIAPVDGLMATVTTDDAALDRWALRNMPEQVNGHVPVVGRLRPPYWRGEAETMVWRPA